MLTLFLEKELKECNHAFMPKVGTNTALRDLALNVPQAKFVYEFDLEHYFGNVSIVDVMFGLAKRGMPRQVLKKLFRTVLNFPRNLSYMETELGSFDERISSREFYANGINRVETIFHDSFEGTPLKFNSQKCEEELEEYLGFSVVGGQIDRILRGLPQGAAPSTILSLSILPEWFDLLKQQGIKLVMYADDGILYSDRPFNPFPPEGMDFAADKSR